MLPSELNSRSLFAPAAYGGPLLAEPLIIEQASAPRRSPTNIAHTARPVEFGALVAAGKGWAPWQCYIIGDLDGKCQSLQVAFCGCLGILSPVELFSETAPLRAVHP